MKLCKYLSAMLSTFKISEIFKVLDANLNSKKFIFAHFLYELNKIDS